MLAESLAIDVDQLPPVRVLFGCHLGENLGRGRERRFAALGVVGVDARILLLGGDGKGQGFPVR
jgi:hypothetical protein